MTNKEFARSEKGSEVVGQLNPFHALFRRAVNNVIRDFAPNLFLDVPSPTILPDPLIDHGVPYKHRRLAAWYEKNGIFKYDVGTILTPNGKSCGYSEEPLSWELFKVLEHTADGRYVLISLTTGEKQTHFKWNIEQHFCIAQSPN